MDTKEAFDILKRFISVNDSHSKTIDKAKYISTNGYDVSESLGVFYFHDGIIVISPFNKVDMYIKQP